MASSVPRANSPKMQVSWAIQAFHRSQMDDPCGRCDIGRTPFRPWNAGRSTRGCDKMNRVFRHTCHARNRSCIPKESPLPQNVQGKRLLRAHPFHTNLPRNHRVSSIMKSELPRSALRRAASRLQVIRMATGQTMCWKRCEENQTQIVWNPPSRFSPLPNHVPALANSTESPAAKPLKRSKHPYA